MKIIETFGIEENKIKNENIVIPICIRNSFFYSLGEKKISQNVIDYIDWALKNTSGKILIFIVDEIQWTNIFVRHSKWNEEKAKRRVLQEGDELRKNTQKYIEENYSIEENRRMDIINWKEYIENNPDYKKYTEIIYEEYKNNPEFSKELMKSLKKPLTIDLSPMNNIIFW